VYKEALEPHCWIYLIILLSLDTVLWTQVFVALSNPLGSASRRAIRLRDLVVYNIGVAPLPIWWYSEAALLPSVVAEIRGGLLWWRGFGF